MKNLFVVILIIFSIKVYAQDTLHLPGTGKDTLITISGFVESYYSYDFNKPKNHLRPVFFYSHNRHNEFNVNLAFLKGNYAAPRVRANLAIATGTYVNSNYSAEPGVLKNIYEANVGYRLSKQYNLWFDMGIMPSHIGWESAHAPSCWTLTRSMAADNSPYFESGAKLSYSDKKDKWLISVLALNGWQRIQSLEGNSLMSWGIQLQFKPSGKVLVNYSNFAGTDKPDTARKWRYFHDIYATIELNEKLGFIAGFDIGQEQKQMGSKLLSTWYTPVVIVRLQPFQKWAIAARAEYFSDENGVLLATGTPKGFKTFGCSINIDWAPASQMLLRLEGRQLVSKDPIFYKEAQPKNGNTAFTFSAAITF